MVFTSFNLDITNLKQQNLAYLPAGSDSLALAKLLQMTKAPLLVITHDGYTAKRIYEEMALFAPTSQVAIFPDSEVLPYERITVQKELTAKRLRTLWQVTSSMLDVLIVQASTLQTRLCPPEYLNQRVFLLKLNDKLSINQLKSKLINSSYSLVEQVYEAGEFAIRGGIIDIMPMGSKKLIRIDLFDEQIESLKILDSKTKQTLKVVDSFELIPTREYPTDSQTLKNLVAKFSNLFTKPQASSLIKELNNGILPAGSDFYLPVFFEATATLFDYLNQSWQVVYFENLTATLNLNWQEITKRYLHFSLQYPCLKPNEVFVPSEVIDRQLKSYPSFIITKSAPLNPNITLLPDISVENKAANPLTKLKQFSQQFSGQIILAIESIGRLEIIRQTLENYEFKPHLINSLNKIPSHFKLLLIQASLHNGFICGNLAFITEQELYRLTDSNLLIKRKKSQTTHINNDAIIRDLAEIKVGDYVVHINHGIGKYLGLTIQTIAGIDYELLELEYQGGSKLFIPVHNLHLISRYSKLENVTVTVSKLGGNAWNKIKERAQKHVTDLASELLELYAKRELQQGNKFALPVEYAEFANSFGYEPTPDQEASFAAVIQDMTSSKPMDRLVCGDVGFGKTEVALRAAFICAMNGRQVAILAPTTLLTEQHYQNFTNRLAGFPLKIAEISRFKTTKEIAQTLQLVASGQVDILIGTHRLIQSDIKFANLGLVIIDEEHRFGVKQKEKLKGLRANVDFLTMTATPIPRTLSMALDGLRDFSIIATPPQRRLAVTTLSCADDNQTIREAIWREIRRGGQVFFLYNDVATIQLMYERLTKLMPELQIAVAHGQLPEHTLELTIRDFIQQRYNLLLCSTIIETGIDIANANTIIIYNAHKLGLAQLYQLRGRVGRSYHQAYCYLIIPPNLNSDALKRLDAIQNASELGSGFNLALHDLEIRGAGEILGDKQSGDIKEVGLSLYTELLKKAIKQLKKGVSLGTLDVEQDTYCEVNLNVTNILPTEYCPDIQERLIYYKRLAKADTVEAIDLVYQEIIDNWGLPPEAVKNLIHRHYLRIKAEKLGIRKLDATTSYLTFTFIDKPPIKPAKIILLLQKLRNCKYDGKNKLIWTIALPTVMDKVKQANVILDELSKQ